MIQLPNLVSLCPLDSGAERLCDRVAIIDHDGLVDAGTLAELVRRHCPETAVVVSGREPAALDACRGLPSVISVTHQDGQATIRGRAGGVVTDAVRTIAEHCADVTGFITEHPTQD